MNDDRKDEREQLTAAGGTVHLPSMDGLEVSPGIYLIGEPTPISGTDTLRALATVGGALCLIELRIKFGEPGRD